ncbi:MAG TPA: thioesterase family protein, partial [Microbacterium sp.]|nr:thioesterase family protein [Microbacterium sp.]
PNVDLTCHLVAQPQGEWIGFDTTVTVGPAGLGLTDTVLHDERGPIGTVQQILTVRPMQPGVSR